MLRVDAQRFWREDVSKADQNRAPSLRERRLEEMRPHPKGGGLFLIHTLEKKRVKLARNLAIRNIQKKLLIDYKAIKS